MLRRPPVVVIKISNSRRIRELTEHTTQYASILCATKSAMPLGRGIAGPQDFNSPARRPSLDCTPQQFARTLFWRPIHPDHDLDPQSALLLEDRLKCPHNTRPQQARHDDRDIERPLVWLAGIGENVKSGFHGGNDTAPLQHCHATPRAALLHFGAPEHTITNRMITAKESNVSATSSFSHEQLLDRLGEVAVRVGLNITPGQQLLITAPLDAAPLVRRVTEHAYKAGASLVTTLYADDETTLARFIHAPDDAFDVAPTWLADGMARAFREGAARMAITGANPTLLKGQDPERISRANRANSKANRPAMEIITQFAVNWNIVACATPAWAAQVFPELPADEALTALWDGIFKASRVDVTDPVAEWKAHNARLHARAKYMNDSRFDALHFSGPGTDLTVGLADGHLWAGGSEKSGNGIVCNPNIPTEEIFTTPHRSKVDGRVSSTKPLFHQGTLIDNIAVRFENGRIVEATASQGEDVLKRILSTDEGAARIGEVALVPHSSPISASKILYRNTLFDENASSHIALGQAYTKCMVDIEGLTPEELLERGVNDSLIHIDWMIGSDKIDLDGLKNGNRVPLMRAGEWVQP